MDPWRVSIVIPCRNAARWLDETLHSVALQLRRPDEVILVDDGSTDPSVDIARRHAASFGARDDALDAAVSAGPGEERHAELRIVAGAGRGASAARALGASLATGDALMFLDADDVLAPDAVAALTDALVPGAIAACPWSRYELDGAGWVVRPASCAPRHIGRDALSAWLRGWYHPPVSLLYSRAALERAGGWDPACSMNQDGDLAMRALAAGVPFVHTGHGMAYYRRLPSGMASLSGGRDSAAGVAERHRVLDKLEAGLREAGSLSGYRADLAAARALVDGRAPPASDRLAATPGRVLRRIRTRLEPVESGRIAALSPAHGARRNAVPPKPLVSVVIPTWRRPEACLRAVSSVRAQGWRRLEIIVVDDASGDDTVERLERLDEARLRVMARDVNGGVARARNDGLAAARGDFIAFLDSDDVWHPEKLDTQLEAFRRTDERVGFVYTGCETIGPNGARRVDPAVHEGWLFGALLERNLLHGANASALLTRRAADMAGEFDPDYPAIEDWDYWVRVARFHAIAAVAAPLVTYADDVEVQRRSRAAAANHAGRARFETRFRAEMRRHGATRGFLFESARRLLADPAADAAEARRLLARACREPGRPLRPGDLQWLPYALAPGAVRHLLRRIDTRPRAAGVTSPARG